MQAMKQWAIALACLAPLACDSDDEVRMARLDISAAIPSAVADNQTASLHFWVLQPREAPSEEEEGVTCGKLRLRDAEAYDPRVIRQADWVVIRADDGDDFGADVIDGTSVLVYVEGISFTGQILVNGCVEYEINGDDSLEVTLLTARTLDCGDDEAEDGSPCDDGMFCTVGEVCDGGSCGGGRERNCSSLADDCNAEACNEELGCHSVPKSENTPCEDGLICTVNDVCDGEGECTAGGPRDCAAEVGADAECYAGTCSEISGCPFVYESNVTTCDADMSSCTPNDQCDGFGNCDADFEDCSALDATATCMLGQCSTAGDACEATDPYTGTGHALCNEVIEVTCGNIPADATPACDATYPGECIGGTPAATDTDCNASHDDDCDGLIDEDGACPT